MKENLLEVDNSQFLLPVYLQRNLIVDLWRTWLYILLSQNGDPIITIKPKVSISVCLKSEILPKLERSGFLDRLLSPPLEGGGSQKCSLSTEPSSAIWSAPIITISGYNWLWWR